MKNILVFLSRKQSSVRSAALVMMLMVLTSRILGLVRDRLLSARFAPEELGVYFAAFRLPNLLFELLVMGVLSTAFIPVFTRYLTKENENAAWRMASNLINLGILSLTVCSIPILVFTETISKWVAPGFSDPQIAQMAIFTRIMILSQVIPLMIGNFFTGILQSYNIFLIPAAAPVIYNVGIILAILFGTSAFGLYAPVIGVGVGAVLFMLLQIPILLHLGYRHKFEFNPKVPGVKEVVTLMIPRTLGLAVSQIDTTVDLILATILGARMVTIFTFAQQLQQLPIGLFGATIAQASLPALSVASVRSDLDKFKEAILSAINQVLFFVLPASALFMVLRIPVVRLIYGSSRFDWQATVLTGTTLSMFSISLFAQALIHVLTRGFYALYDSRTPVFVGIVGITINTVLSIWFVNVLHLPVWSLGLSTSVASIVHVILLFIFLDRKVKGFSRSQLIIPPIKIGIAAVLTGVMLYIPIKLLDQLVFDTTRTFNLILLTGISGCIGLTTYLFLAWVLGVSEVQSFFLLLKKVRSSGHILLEPANEAVNSSTQDQVS